MRFMLATALAALTVLFASAGHGAEPARTTDREQITAVMAALDATWNKHDMRAHGELFHENAVWIAWTGEELIGAAFLAKLAAGHETVWRKSVHRGRIEELTLVAPDVAVVRGYGTAVGNAPTPEKIHQYRILVVLTKRNGAWKIGWGQKTRFADSMPDISSSK